MGLLTPQCCVCVFLPVDCSVKWQISTKYGKNVISLQASLRGSVVGWGTMLQAGRSRVRVSMTLDFFFNLPNPSSSNMALGSSQPLTEMRTKNFPGG
jgi:hypothetical protein